MFQQIASDWLLLIFSTFCVLVAFIYKRDIGTFHAQLNRKADQVDMDELKRQVEKMSDAAVESKISLATIDQRLARIVSDLDSEKRTRGAANSDIQREVRDGLAAITKQLDVMRLEIPRYGRRHQDGDGE